MNAPGVSLDRLIRRLAECPPEFLAEPRLGGQGRVRVPAVVSDLLEELQGEPLGAREASRLESSAAADRNRLRVVLVATWLLADESLRRPGGELWRKARAWLLTGLDPLAAVITADLLVTDPDRREELARLCLDALGLLPAGETTEQAADRLRALDSVERREVIRRTKEQVERARRLRKKMEEEAAREAAARATRE